MPFSLQFICFSFFLLSLLSLCSSFVSLPNSLVSLCNSFVYARAKMSSSLPSSISLYYPSYEDCAPYSCGNSTIRSPFGTCAPLDVNCEANQTILYDDAGSGGYGDWRVIGDITKSPPNHPQITPKSPLQITPKSLPYSTRTYYWLINGGVFNLTEAYMVGTIVSCRQKPAGIDVNSWVDCTESNTYCFFYNVTGFYIRNCDSTSKSYNISLDKDLQQLWQTGGICYNSDQYYDTCICRNGDVHYSNCTDGDVLQYGKIQMANPASRDQTAGTSKECNTQPSIAENST